MLPDPESELENVEFQDTTTYHWGKFDANATNTNGFEDAQGPFAFGLATKLNKEKDQVHNSHCLKIIVFHAKNIFFLVLIFAKIFEL